MVEFMDGTQLRIFGIGRQNFGKIMRTFVMSIVFKNYPHVITFGIWSPIAMCPMPSEIENPNLFAGHWGPYFAAHRKSPAQGIGGHPGVAKKIARGFSVHVMEIRPGGGH